MRGPHLRRLLRVPRPAPKRRLVQQLLHQALRPPRPSRSSSWSRGGLCHLARQRAHRGRPVRQGGERHAACPHRDQTVKLSSLHQVNASSRIKSTSAAGSSQTSEDGCSQGVDNVNEWGPFSTWIRPDACSISLTLNPQLPQPQNLTLDNNGDLHEDLGSPRRPRGGRG